MQKIIKDIMQSYRVYPTESEKITDRLFRIRDGRRTYALKQSALTKENVALWQHVYAIANEKNLSEIAPVYLTREGKLYLETDESFYYLTPWIETPSTGNLKNNMENTMQNLGRLHVTTMKSHRISKDSLNDNFLTYQAFCKETPIELKRIVHQFESNRYMSPFELLVCTQYRDVEYALKMNNDIIDEFLEPSDETLTWNHCLCHGNLTPDHTVGRYIINWETVRYDHPAVDLANYFNHLTGNYDQPQELITDAFKIYKNKNDLNRMELKLLSIYLLHPSTYITTIQNYVNNTSGKSMELQVRDIQQQFRKLLFAIKWNKFIIEEYETISFEDADY
ncbi:spore coat protein YsxE [Oceanobacillus rekensis]|uniref:spore coat protein YsxE n=1 Tax=Oceanobacillus rekensis TaxID=937927 RepID=UPI000B44F818|nr:spore coat protein YsxE [Oceanobacillus rekensis]